MKTKQMRNAHTQVCITSNLCEKADSSIVHLIYKKYLLFK